MPRASSSRRANTTDHSVACLINSNNGRRRLECIAAAADCRVRVTFVHRLFDRSLYGRVRVGGFSRADPATGTARYSSPERGSVSIVVYPPVTTAKRLAAGDRPDRLNLSKQNRCVVEMPAGPVDPDSAAST